MNHPSLALCLAVLTALSASFSCEKTPGAGSGVSFRAKADGTTTKTAYGDISGNTQNYQMLNWVSGDRIRVYSPQAVKIYTADVHFADYKVDGVKTEGTTSVATLLSSDDGNGLGWQESGTHYFYSVYPSPAAVNNNITIEEGTGSNAVTVTGTIPATQTLSWSGVLGTPDMRYAYMYASTSTAPQSQVDLTFRPRFTAFQFEIGPGEHTSIHLTGFTLSTTDATRPLSGTFTISGVAGSETLTCPTSGTGVSTSLTVSMNATLTTGNTLILTVFALPRELEHLSISFTGDEIGTRSLALKQEGEYISFAACKKYRFYGLSFPKVGGIVASGEGIEWDGSYTISTNDGELIAWAANHQLSGTQGEGLSSWVTNAELSGSGGEGISSWTTEE